MEFQFLKFQTLTFNLHLFYHCHCVPIDQNHRMTLKSNAMFDQTSIYEKATPNRTTIFFSHQ